MHFKLACHTVCEIKEICSTTLQPWTVFLHPISSRSQLLCINILIYLINLKVHRKWKSALCFCIFTCFLHKGSSREGLYKVFCPPVMHLNVQLVYTAQCGALGILLLASYSLWMS